MFMLFKQPSFKGGEGGGGFKIKIPKPPKDVCAVLGRAK